jgi:hypothetical protein
MEIDECRAKLWWMATAMDGDDNRRWMAMTRDGGQQIPMATDGGRRTTMVMNDDGDKRRTTND